MMADGAIDDTLSVETSRYVPTWDSQEPVATKPGPSTLTFPGLRPESDSPIRYMVRVKLPLDLGALRQCWTARSDFVREDLRVSDEIPKDV
jgi:hypothetical protein